MESRKFQKMLFEINNCQYDLVIVVDQFRICRTEEFHIFKAMLKESTIVNLHKQNQEQSQTSLMKMMF